MNSSREFLHQMVRDIRELNAGLEFIETESWPTHCKGVQECGCDDDVFACVNDRFGKRARYVNRLVSRKVANASQLLFEAVALIRSLEPEQPPKEEQKKKNKKEEEEEEEEEEPADVDSGS